MGRNISYSHSPFRGRTTLSSLTIGNSVTSLGSYAFFGCSGLTSIDIPSSVTKIDDYAFSDCSSLESVNMSDNIISIGSNAFDSNSKLYVKRGSKTLLTFWNTKTYDGSLVYKPHEKSTDKVILPPSFNILSTTQTTAKVKIENWCDGYTYTYNGEETTKKKFDYTKLKPASTQNLNLVVSLDDVQYKISGSFTTQSLVPRIDEWTVTASSISATGAYTEDDAKVVSDKIAITGYNYYYGEPSVNDKQEGNHIFVSGLNPGRGYTVNYTIEVDYGGEKTATYTGSNYIYTQGLQFSTAAPKVVSAGNVIVSATANLDDDETNVGFEWRCTDWTDEFPSNTGTAYYFDGTIEGYIKNMNTDKLWKFRPYYLSDTGTYHYGDWMGLDPTNTSYFEPTVRTYAKISVEGNTALVKGYVLGGTDNVAVKGFKYWRTNTGTKLSTRSVSLPSNAITVEATGQQAMSANLTGLEYNSTYHYVAFATTTSGETYYGEEQMFTTPLATSQYATFYDSQSAYILPSGLTASVVTGVSNGKLTYKVIADGTKNNKVVPKGVAVMLTSSKGQPSSYKMTPTTSYATYTGTNLLRGSDVTTTTTADGSCWYYKLSYGASGTAQSGVFGWYWGANNGGAFQIEGHKAWLAIPKSSGTSSRSISIEGNIWDMDDEATDIEGIDICQEEDEAYYDLNGCRIEKPTSKGIYIYKGKKIMIR